MIIGTSSLVRNRKKMLLTTTPLLGVRVDVKNESLWLMQGDCLERMKEIPDGSVDLTVTSPPYDKLRSYNGNNALWGQHVWEAVIKDLYRVTADGGVVVWVVADATIKGSETGTSFKQALYAMECGFRLHDTMIYKKDAIAFPDKNRYQACFEYMFIFSKMTPKVKNLIADKPNKSYGRRVTGTNRLPNGKTIKASCYGQDIKPLGVRWNVWDISTDKGNVESDHPAKFPYQLAHDHIISWSNEGDTILDPFMGSGTTGIACVNLNRKFVGVEMDKGYFDMCVNRIRCAGSDVIDNISFV
jgi:DNA modification methylase